jgi:hypothetical protein
VRFFSQAVFECWCCRDIVLLKRTLAEQRKHEQERVEQALRDEKRKIARRYGQQGPAGGWSLSATASKNHLLLLQCQKCVSDIAAAGGNLLKIHFYTFRLPRVGVDCGVQIQCLHNA